jgi:hypothetical protein
LKPAAAAVVVETLDLQPEPKMVVVVMLGEH